MAKLKTALIQLGHDMPDLQDHLRAVLASMKDLIESRSLDLARFPEAIVYRGQVSGALSLQDLQEAHKEMQRFQYDVLKICSSYGVYTPAEIMVQGGSEGRLTLSGALTCMDTSIAESQRDRFLDELTKKLA